MRQIESWIILKQYFPYVQKGPRSWVQRVVKFLVPAGYAEDQFDEVIIMHYKRLQIRAKKIVALEQVVQSNSFLFRRG